MDNKQMQELLPDYVRGLLDTKEMAAIELALTGSRELREECNRLVAYYKAIDALDPIKAPDDFLAKINNRLDREPVFVRFLKTVFMPLQIKLPLELAGLAATALLIIVIYKPFQIPKAPAIQEVAEYAPQPAEPVSAPAVKQDKPAAPKALKEVAVIQNDRLSKSGALSKSVPVARAPMKSSAVKAEEREEVVAFASAPAGTMVGAGAERSRAADEAFSADMYESEKAVPMAKSRLVQGGKSDNGGAMAAPPSAAAVSQVAMAQPQEMPIDAGIMDLLLYPQTNEAKLSRRAAKEAAMPSADKKMKASASAESMEYTKAVPATESQPSSQSVAQKIKSIVSGMNGSVKEVSDNEVRLVITLPASNITSFVSKIASYGVVDKKKLVAPQNSASTVFFTIILHH